MIISMKYAKELVRKGKAQMIEGHITNGGCINARYQIVTRLDVTRIDHVLLKGKK